MTSSFGNRVPTTGFSLYSSLLHQCYCPLKPKYVPVRLLKRQEWSRAIRYFLNLLNLGNHCFTSRCLWCAALPQLPPQLIHTSDVKNRNSPLCHCLLLSFSLPYTLFWYIGNMYLHFYTPGCEKHYFTCFFHCLIVRCLFHNGNHSGGEFICIRPFNNKVI